MRQHRNDLDELNRPPRRMRVLPQRALAAGAEHDTYYTNRAERTDGDGDMGEPTLGEILITEMSDIKKLLNDSLKTQAQTNLDTVRRADAMQHAIDDLQAWRKSVEQAPEQTLQRQATRASITWQHLSGYIGVASLVLVVITNIVAPFVAAHWH